MFYENKNKVWTEINRRIEKGLNIWIYQIGLQ